MQRKDLIILNKIIEELDIVLNAVGGKSFEDFNRDELFKRGVCMTVINIGELVKGLSPEFRLKYTSVPWKEIAGFRDIAAHKYAALDMYDVYDTVTNDFPELKRNIIEILKQKNSPAN